MVSCDFGLVQIVVRTEEGFERSVVGGTGLGGLRVDFIIGGEGFAAIIFSLSLPAGTFKTIGALVFVTFEFRFLF